jgi:Auxin responsive protein
MMLNPIRLVEIPRKSQNKTKSNMPASPKGHFAAYTRDGQRFLVPISYLNSKIFKDLLKLAEEEYGVSSDGPLVLPCDASFMRRTLEMLQSSKAKC